MADDASQDNTPQEEPKKGPNKMIIMGGAALVMILEAAAVYFIIGMTSASQVDAAAGAIEIADEDDPERMVELELIEERFFNATTGRPYVFNVRVALQVRQKNAERVTSDMERRKAEIAERVGNAIASSTLRHLMYEPDRGTIKRRLDAVMLEIFGEVNGEPRVEQVLIPKLDGAPVDI